MADISHIQINGETLDIKDASGGGILTGTVPVGETLRFTGDGIEVFFNVSYYTLSATFNGVPYILEPSTIGVIFVDGGYQAVDEKEAEFNYILIGATLLD